MIRARAPASTTAASARVFIEGPGPWISDRSTNGAGPGLTRHDRGTAVGCPKAAAGHYGGKLYASVFTAKVVEHNRLVEYLAFARGNIDHRLARTDDAPQPLAHAKRGLAGHPRRPNCRLVVSVHERAQISAAR